MNQITAIPAFDYKRSLAKIRPEIDEAFARVLDSGWLVLGKEVESFESELADYCGCSHAVGLNSGTDALILALKALNIGQGDEVLTVSNTAVPTVSAIRAAGANPVFVDINPGSLSIDPTQIEHAITPKTKAVIAVHMHGLPVDIQAVAKITRKFGLKLIEDCAQAFGSLYKGKPVGTYGDIGCFSFYPTKNLGAFGDGGLCLTDNPELAERIKMLRMYGFKGSMYAHIEGVNSRLDELQAALLRVQLKHFDKAVKGRRRVAAEYRRLFEGSGLQLPYEDNERKHSYHLFVIQTPDRDALASSLKEASIGFGIHYPTPIHLMSAYSFLGYEPGSLPNTEAASSQILSLPMFPELTNEEVARVVDQCLAATTR